MSLSTEALLHLHPGRKRIKHRRPNADRDHRPVEPVEAIQSIAKAYRLNHGACEDDPLHELNGSTLGRLTLEGSVSTDQRYTGLRYATIVFSYSRVMGVPSPFPRTTDLARANGGLSCSDDYSTEEATEIKSRFRDCRRILLDTGKDLLVGSAVNRIVYGVVIEDWPMGAFGRGDIQNLRCGLNALDRIMKTWERR